MNIANNDTVDLTHTADELDELKWSPYVHSRTIGTPGS